MRARLCGSARLGALRALLRMGGFRVPADKIDCVVDAVEHLGCLVDKCDGKFVRLVALVREQRRLLPRDVMRDALRELSNVRCAQVQQRLLRGGDADSTYTTPFAQDVHSCATPITSI